jgi:hypothetical protein
VLKKSALRPIVSLAKTPWEGHLYLCYHCLATTPSDRLCWPIFASKDTEALGDHHKLGQRRGFELFHDVMTMRFDGSFGRAELACDLLVHLSPHHPFKDLSFARA